MNLMSTNSEYPIIVHSHLGWDWVWQRPQQFLSRLSARHPVLLVEGPVPDPAIDKARLEIREIVEFPAITVLRMAMPGAKWFDGAWVDDERRRLFRSNGSDQVGIAITRQSQANDLEIAKGVNRAVAEINKTLPKGTSLVVAIDYTQFTQQAIHEVWITMAISLAMVALVNFVFLGTWRAALIPSIVAPICIL